MTGRAATVAPSRIDIETEIAAADKRRDCGVREGRADAAATTCCRVIGDDDCVLCGDVEHAKGLCIADRLSPAWHGEGVKHAISWLSGDYAGSLADPAAAHSVGNSV